MSTLIVVNMKNGKSVVSAAVERKILLENGVPDHEIEIIPASSFLTSFDEYTRKFTKIIFFNVALDDSIFDKFSEINPDKLSVNYIYTADFSDRIQERFLLSDGKIYFVGCPYHLYYHYPGKLSQFLEIGHFLDGEECSIFNEKVLAFVRKYHSELEFISDAVKNELVTSFNEDPASFFEKINEMLDGDTNA